MLIRFPDFKSRVGEGSFETSAHNPLLPFSGGDLAEINEASNLAAPKVSTVVGMDALVYNDAMLSEGIGQPKQNFNTTFSNADREENTNSDDELKIDLLKILAHW